MHATALVTGASRGIGLHLVRELLEKGWHVCASCRQASEALVNLHNQNPSTLEVVAEVDVGSDAGCSALKTLSVGSVGLVVCNAGAFANDNLDAINFEEMRNLFEVNSLGVLRTVLAVKPKLHTGSKVVVIGSKLGSIAHNTNGTRYAYRMSKCAAHMAAVSMAAELKLAGIAVAIIHPGVVQTDMVKVSGSTPEVSPEESAIGIVKTIDLVTLETTGQFWNYLGEKVAF